MFLSVSLKQLSLLGPVQYIPNALAREVRTMPPCQMRDRELIQNNYMFGEG